MALSESVCPEPVDLVAPEDIYVPINNPQVSELVGRVLTLIDALGLQPNQGKAAKDIARQHVYDWFNDARENAETSYRGCIAPIRMLRNANGTERGTVWTADGQHMVVFDDGVVGVVGQTVSVTDDPE